jgi:hypothetical protein
LKLLVRGRSFPVRIRAELLATVSMDGYCP